jgi:hypothetical protein
MAETLLRKKEPKISWNALSTKIVAVTLQLVAALLLFPLSMDIFFRSIA